MVDIASWGQTRYKTVFCRRSTFKGTRGSYLHLCHPRSTGDCSNMTEFHSAISIVIPSLNSRLIAQTVESVLMQETADQLLEIIVVGLDDDHLIPAHDKVRHISTSQPVSAARGSQYRISRGSRNYCLLSGCRLSGDARLVECACGISGPGLRGGRRRCCFRRRQLLVYLR